MADQDESNGGLPPKISLKPSAPPASPKAPEAASRVDAAKPAYAPKPIPTKPIVLKPASSPPPSPPQDTSAEPRAGALPSGDAEKPSPVAPKRPVLRPVGTAGAPRKPVPIGIRKDAAELSSGPKKSTSRITLPAPSDSNSKTSKIKTIKIAPRPLNARIEGEGEDTAETPPPAPATADPKRQTSRISLESVLGGEGSKDGEQPTIKIKRSTDAPTIRVAGATAGDRKPEEKTIPIPETDASDGSEKPESQKKTLKVKRPVSSGSAGKPQAGVTLFAPPTATLIVSDEPHWIFSIITMAATLVTAVLIYALAAQALEPDLAERHDLESKPSLPWPGRLVP